jgi:hypothetical protein
LTFVVPSAPGFEVTSHTSEGFENQFDVEQWNQDELFVTLFDEEKIASPNSKG